MKDIDTSELERLLIEAKGEGYNPDNVKAVEKDVSEVLFTGVMGGEPYEEVLDRRYGKGNWARYHSEDTLPGHCDIVAYIEPALESAQETEAELESDDDDVLWSKTAGGRTLTLLRGGLYEEKKEK